MRTHTQLEMPRWEIVNFGPEVRSIHLSYHDHQHYASIRNKSDPGGGVPTPIVIGTPSKTSSDTKPTLVMDALPLSFLTSGSMLVAVLTIQGRLLLLPG